MKSLLAATLSVALAMPALAQLSRPAPPRPTEIDPSLPSRSTPDQSISPAPPPKAVTKKPPSPATGPTYSFERDFQRCSSYGNAIYVAVMGNDRLSFDRILSEYRSTCLSRGDRDTPQAVLVIAAAGMLAFGNPSASLKLADEALRVEYALPDGHVARAEALSALQRYPEAKMAIAAAEAALGSRERKAREDCTSASLADLCATQNENNRGARQAIERVKGIVAQSSGDSSLAVAQNQPPRRVSHADTGGQSLPHAAAAITTTAEPHAATSARVACPNYVEVMSSISYPREALKENLEGTVVVEFTVTAGGEVKDAVIKSSTQPVFNRASLAATTQLRCKSNGRDLRVQAPIGFKLR